MYSLTISHCGWYILFTVKIFRVFLSLTLTSSFVHFSIPAPYLTKDTAQEFIPLIIFPPFHFNDISCLTLLKFSFCDLIFPFSVDHVMRFQKT